MPEPRTARYVPVQGSGSWVSPAFKRMVSGPQWWQQGSALDVFLTARGCTHLNDENPYLWNTSVGGLEVFWRWIKKKPVHPDHRDWATAGWQLKLYFELQQVPVSARVVVTHSHGLQPLLYACAYGLEIDRLLSFGGPVRADMSEIAGLARPRIGQWLSVANPDDDTQRQGQWFDGSFDKERCHPLADWRDLVPNIGHGKVLREPTYFHYWDDLNWNHFLLQNFKDAA